MSSPTSSIFSPCVFSSLGTVNTGPMPISSGSAAGHRDAALDTKRLQAAAFGQRALSEYSSCTSREMPYLRETSACLENPHVGVRDLVELFHPPEVAGHDHRAVHAVARFLHRLVQRIANQDLSWLSQPARIPREPRHRGITQSKILAAPPWISFRSAATHKGAIELYVIHDITTARPASSTQ